MQLVLGPTANIPSGLHFGGIKSSPFKTSLRVRLLRCFLVRVFGIFLT